LDLPTPGINEKRPMPQNGDVNRTFGVIVYEPEDKPWKLREFMAADLDGNLIRVFYDFRRDICKNAR